MPVEACSEKPPFSSSGIPQQYSITSRPRATSPIASDKTLPCSSVRMRPISSRRWSTRSRILKRSAVRLDSDIARQAGNASFAACTARSTSPAVAKSTAPVWTPRAGL